MVDQASFFRPGGTLEPSAESYICRPADWQLLDAVVAGECVFVLDSRQKGKSSLIARSISKLIDAGIKPVKIDLQRIGTNVTPEQWYGSLAVGVGQEVGLSSEVINYWQANQNIGPLARLMSVIEVVVLPKCNGPIAIFIDEVDFVRALNFSTDEFFAAIREAYNRRSSNELLKKLTFCLVGVATPGQLVRNIEISPFNIGKRIDLTDFTLEETRGYSKSLDVGGRNSEMLVDRVHYWVNGHPYLTQLLCSRISSDGNILTSADVDQLVKELFLLPESRHREANLSEVERKMLDPYVPGLSPDESRVQVLDIYGRMLKSKGVDASERNPVVATLRLSGIGIEQGGILRVRNRVYRRIFNEQWRRQNLPNAELRRQRHSTIKGAFIVGCIALVIITIVSYLAVRNNKLAEERDSALKISKISASKAEQESYIRTMELMDLESRGNKWLRVRQLHDKSSNSPFKGWEWDHWELRLNSHLQEFSLPKGIGVAEIQRIKENSWTIEGNGCLSRLQDGTLKILRQEEALGSSFAGESLWVVNKPENAIVFDRLTGNQLYSLPKGKAYTRTHSDIAVLSDGKSLSLYRLSRTGATQIRVLPFRHIWSTFQSDRWVCIVDKKMGCTIVDLHLNRVRQFVSNVFDRWITGIFLSDEKHALLYHGNSIVELDLESLVLRQTPFVHNAPINSASLNADESILTTASQDGTVKIWDYRAKTLRQTFYGHREGVRSAVVSQDNCQILSGASDGEIRVWDIQAPTAIWTVQDTYGQINMLRINRNGTRLVRISDDGWCNVYDTVSRKILLKFGIGKSPPPGLLKLTPDGNSAIVGGSNGDIWCLDLLKGSIRWTSKPCISIITSTGFSQDQKELLVGDLHGNLAMVSLKSGEIINQKAIVDAKITGTEFSQDATSVAIGCGKDLIVCKRSDLKEIRRLDNPGGRDVRSLAFAPNGDLLVCWVLNPQTLAFPSLKKKVDFRGHTDRVYGAQLSKSGKYVLTHSSDGTVRIWEYASGKEIQVLRHDSWVSTVEFSDDESRVITSSDDHTAKIWSVSTGEQLTELLSPTSPMFCASFSGDQSTVATGAKNGMVTVFFTRKSEARRIYDKANSK